MTRLLLLTILMLTGCVQLPPLPGDATAKRFETVPDRAVIYVARPRLDKDFVAPLLLDDQMIGATYRGTYMHIIVPPGKHRIAGYAGDSGVITLQTEPGRLYFVNQTTQGFRSLSRSSFELVTPQYGREVVLSGTLTSEITQ